MTPNPTIPAATLTDTALVSILRDCDREVRDSVRLAAADRIDQYRRQLGHLERIVQSIDPTISPVRY